MISISADLRLFCSKSGAVEVGLVVLYFGLALLLGFLGPAIFFRGHNRLGLYTMPFSFRWKYSVMLISGGMIYAGVLLFTRRFFARRRHRRVQVSNDTSIHEEQSPAH